VVFAHKQVHPISEDPPPSIISTKISASKIEIEIESNAIPSKVLHEIQQAKKLTISKDVRIIMTERLLIYLDETCSNVVELGAIRVSDWTFVSFL